MKSKRNLSSFGDVLVNFLYSWALSRASGEWEGRKVQNKTLASSLSRSVVGKPRRSDKQMLGNYVESAIAEAWVSGRVTSEECVDVLASHLRAGDEESHREAFTALLDFVSGRMGHGKITDEDTGH